MDGVINSVPPFPGRKARIRIIRVVVEQLLDANLPTRAAWAPLHDEIAHGGSVRVPTGLSVARPRGTQRADWVPERTFIRVIFEQCIIGADPL